MAQRLREAQVKMERALSYAHACSLDVAKARARLHALEAEEAGAVEGRERAEVELAEAERAERLGQKPVANDDRPVRHVTVSVGK